MSRGHAHRGRKDKVQEEIVSALRDVGARVYIIGEPVDLLVGHRKRWLTMECKKPKGKETRQQSDHRVICEVMGLPHVVVRSDTEALVALGAISA